MIISYPDCIAATITIYITISRWNSIFRIGLSQPVILFQYSLPIG